MNHIPYSILHLPLELLDNISLTDAFIFVYLLAMEL